MSLRFRLKGVTPDSVVFATKQGKTTTVAPVEFVRRFVLPILPGGFVKIRHYGLFAGKRVRQALPLPPKKATGGADEACVEPLTSERSSQADDAIRPESAYLFP